MGAITQQLMSYGGSLVGFPVVEGTTTGGSASTSAQAITMPSGVTIGDLLVVLFAYDNAPPAGITGTNWFLATTADNAANTVGVSLYTKFADGADTLTVNLSPAEQCEYIAYRISGAGGVTGLPVAVNTDTMPTCTPIEGSSKYLWIAASAFPSVVTVTTPPSGYGNNINVGVAGADVSLSASRRVFESTSESPGAFTASTPATNAALITIAVPAAAAPTDASYASVISLNNWPGTDGATTFTDAKGKVWTAQGNAQIDTGRPWFGNPTLLLDGTGDYLTSPDATDWRFGSSDFTIENWAYFTADPVGETVVISKWGAGNDLSFYYGRASAAAARSVAFYYRTNGGTNVFTDSTSSIFSNYWSYSSFSRIGNTGYYHIDGVQQGTIDLTGVTVNISTTTTVIGAVTGGGTPSTGNFGPLRVTNGVGRYGAFNYPRPARLFATQ